MLKFDASIFSGELPVGLGVVGIAVVLPGGDFVEEDLFVGRSARKAYRGGWRCERGHARKSGLRFDCPPSRTRMQRSPTISRSGGH